MKTNEENLLRDAVKAVRSTEASAAEFSAAARRVAERLGAEEFAMETQGFEKASIDGCGDVRRLLSAYRAGSLAQPRALLVAAHVRECGSCSQELHGVGRGAGVDWSAPALATSAATAARGARVPFWRSPAFRWAAAPACALLFGSLFVYKAYWQVMPGVRAEVRSIDGTAYRVSDTGERQLAPGDGLSEGEHIRTSGGGHAVLRLADGSSVEMNERSVMAVNARGHDTTLALENGDVIVQAAKREAGHLYVKTADFRVAVTGTMFSVGAGIKGSRVAVFQGAVEVSHAGKDEVVRAGEQMATNDDFGSAPIAQQVAWSHDQAKYLSLLAAAANFQHRLEQVPFPGPRYSSDLLGRVPADTLLYVSVPNLGEFLAQANHLFQQQLQQSPELQQWWSRGGKHNTEELDSMVGKLHELSGYLGDEVVIVGLKQNKDAAFAVVADLRKGGLQEYLQGQFADGGKEPGLTVVTEDALRAAGDGAQGRNGGYALIRQREVVFSNSLATLRVMSRQLDAGTSGFEAGDFGQQISAAYRRGAGVILAADLHQMMLGMPETAGARSRGTNVAAQSGLEDVQYLIAEHREVNDEPVNHLNLQFSGPRQRVASWLAAPAPIGSLGFVSSNAAVAVAMLSKDPKAIADDIIAMAATAGEGRSDTDEALKTQLRDEVAANLGGDFLLSLDGPMLPTPAWKVVVEVNNSERLEGALERLMQWTQSRKGVRQLRIEASEVSGKRSYSVVETNSGVSLTQYTFADGYLVMAPNRALLEAALRTHERGNSLAHAASFKALLPKDENDNCSAVAYQNLSPVLTPLLSQFNGPEAAAIQELASDARPTAVCAWGKDNRIEAGTNSRLMGFDFLTLAALLHPGNKAARAGALEGHGRH